MPDQICPHCNYSWEARKELPKNCPKCKRWLDKEPIEPKSDIKEINAPVTKTENKTLLKIAFIYLISIIFIIFIILVITTLVSADSFTLDKNSTIILLDSGGFKTFAVNVHNPHNNSIKFNITANETATKFLFFDDLVEIEKNSTKKVTIGVFSSPFSPPGEYALSLLLNTALE